MMWEGLRLMMKRFLGLVLVFCLVYTQAAGESLCDPDKLLPAGEEAVITENSYKSPNISIEITAQRVLNADIYVADIYVRSIDCFQRALSHDKWKAGSQKINVIAKEHEGILVMTGDSSENLSVGMVMVNGKIIRKTKNRKRDLGLIYRSGEMVTIPAADVNLEEILAAADDLWQVFLFGPALLDKEGKAMTAFSSDVKPKNPRSVIGYYAPGHYCFVQVDGRNTPSKLEKGKKNKGLTLNELSEFMESLGCAAAYNLDGGQSSILYFNGGIYSSPYNNGRKLGDVVLIREPVPAEPEAASTP